MRKSIWNRTFQCQNTVAKVGLAIESSNVVGYQNLDASTKSSIYLNTFKGVTAGTAMTLGDISANSFNDEEGEYDVCP